MTTCGDPRVDLGANMFSELAELFVMTMENHGYTTGEDRTVVYAGFLSVVVGQMCHTVGVENTHTVIDAVKNGATGALRSRLKVVKV